MTNNKNEEHSNAYYLMQLRRMGIELEDDEQLINLALESALWQVKNRNQDGIYHVNQSPFHKESHYARYVRDAPMEKISFRIPKTAYNDLMTYFKGQGMDKSEGFNKILTDKLEMINTSKRTIFNNTELIMLIPKTRNLTELNSKSKIIGIYNPDKDFDSAYVYKEGFKKAFNIRYELRQFMEGNFPLEDLSMMKESRIFGVRLGELTDWDSFYSKMSLIYEDLDLDKSYFVRFPLNNYLDVNRQGQFQHPKYMGKHQGLYAFDDLGYHGAYMTLDWNYYSDLLKCKFEFIPRDEFYHILRNSSYAPLNNALEDFKDSEFHKRDIENAIAETKRALEFLENLHDKI